jgi:hypothetical protein
MTTFYLNLFLKFVYSLATYSITSNIHLAKLTQIFLTILFQYIYIYIYIYIEEKYSFFKKHFTNNEILALMLMELVISGEMADVLTALLV